MTGFAGGALLGLLLVGRPIFLVTGELLARKEL